MEIHEPSVEDMQAEDITRGEDLDGDETVRLRR